MVSPANGADSVVVPAEEVSAAPIAIRNKRALSTPLACVVWLADDFKKQFPDDDPVAKYETP